MFKTMVKKIIFEHKLTSFETHKSLILKGICLKIGSYEIYNNK